MPSDIPALPEAGHSHLGLPRAGTNFAAFVALRVSQTAGTCRPLHGTPEPVGVTLQSHILAMCDFLGNFTQTIVWFLQLV
jgi:hypothetical protein